MSSDIEKLIENLSVKDIDLLSKKLSDIRYQKIFGHYKSEIINKISIEKYNDFYNRIRKIHNFKQELHIMKPFEISCEIYQPYSFSSIEKVDVTQILLNVSIYGSDDNSNIIKESDFSKIEKELHYQFELIKKECNELGINASIFIMKIIDEIYYDEQNIRDIIE